MMPRPSRTQGVPPDRHFLNSEVLSQRWVSKTAPTLRRGRSGTDFECCSPLIPPTARSPQGGEYRGKACELAPETRKWSEKKQTAQNCTKECTGSIAAYDP